MRKEKPKILYRYIVGALKIVSHRLGPDCKPTRLKHMADGYWSCSCGGTRSHFDGWSSYVKAKKDAIWMIEAEIFRLNRCLEKFKGVLK